VYKWVQRSARIRVSTDASFAAHLYYRQKAGANSVKNRNQVNIFCNPTNPENPTSCDRGGFPANPRYKLLNIRILYKCKPCG